MHTDVRVYRVKRVSESKGSPWKEIGTFSAQRAQVLQPKSHPKAIEHPSGLPKLQSSHVLPTPSPLWAPITLEPDSLVEENIHK